MVFKFIFYKKEKEIGLYSLLGLKKSQIGKMLFYENLVIGGLALVVGIVLGTLLSKVFIMLMMKVMAVDGLVTFKLIPKAMIQTAIVFTILFFITSSYGASTIYRYKLIQLFKAYKTGEKQPKVSSIFSIISVVMIIFCYLIVLKFDVGFMVKLIGGLILAVIGTFGVFSSFTIFAIKTSKKNKKRYYKNINMIGASQLIYRIKGNARTLAIIALLTATTLTSMGTGMLVFIGGTIGLIFLISTGSIIFFKQLSEAEDDKGMYKILRKIGVSNKLINKSIRKQMLFIFGAPLVLGIIHSLVAFKFLSDMLNKNLFIPIFVTFGIYAVIYIFYYFLTVYNYTNIVNEN